MIKNQTRRNFMRAVPFAAVTFSFNDELLFAEGVDQTPKPVPFELFTAGELGEAMTKLQSATGDDKLFSPTALPFTIVMTTEKAKSAKEFEYHEGRDHIIQIIDGSTLYEVGGTPQNARNIRQNEWLAPASKDATKYTLHKGDMLVLPRGTPHKRSTEDSVTLILISTTGN